MAYDPAGGNDGTVYGATMGATGLLGTTAYDFTYSNADYVDIPDFSTFSQYTITGWFNPGTFSTGGFQTVVLLGQNNNLHLGYWNSSHSNGERFRFNHNDGGGSENIYSSPLSTDTWYHFAQTWDGSTVRGYLSGGEVGSVAMSSMGTSRNESDALGVGTDNFRWPLDGRLAGIRVYNTELIQPEVTTLRDVVAAVGEWAGTAKAL